MQILPLNEIAITHRSALTCLGASRDDHVEAMRAGRSGLRPCDFRDAAVPGFIGRVDAVESIAMPTGLEVYGNRATRLAVMGLQSGGVAEHVRAAVDQFGAHRVGLVIGTSTSGVDHLEELYRARDGEDPLPAEYQIRHHNDHHAVTAFLGSWLGLAGPTYTVSTACSSSAKAVIDAAQLIQLGLCDAVLAGGIDSLCLTSLYGFEALELVSRAPCRPFDARRDGLSIGEGAGFLLLQRNADGPRLVGYGETSDAVHMSTPPPDGAGAAAAMRAALDRAGLAPDDVDFVKLHGTGTPANDAAEGIAVAGVLPAAPAASFKGMIGHTLGAAGALEAVLCLDAMEAGIVPGTVGLEAADTEIPLAPSQTTVPGRIRHAISNAFGFGGSNASLVLSIA